ncbi:MAG: hypothetical protein AAF587_40340 [Bacteroidota bacterium]
MNHTHTFFHTAGYLQKILFCLLLLFGLTDMQAQNQPYKLGAGLRMGYPMAVSVKTFLGSSAHAVEGTIGTRGFGLNRIRWTAITGGYLVHRDADQVLETLNVTDVGHLSYYFGAGASAMIWSYNNPIDRDRYGSTSFGIQGYLGLEFRINDLPLAIGTDWVPSLFLGNSYLGGLGLGYGTLAIRYVIK